MVVYQTILRRLGGAVHCFVFFCLLMGFIENKKNKDYLQTYLLMQGVNAELLTCGAGLYSIGIRCQPGVHAIWTVSAHLKRKKKK